MPITTWGRLEPDTESLDPSDGLARGLTNRLGDPLWLLSRQHSLGELRGEDAGLPVAVELILERHPVTALTIDGVTAPVSPGVPWEAEVEAEPDQIDLRLRLRGGELLAAMLAEAGLSEVAAWMEEYPAEIAAGWQAGFIAGPGTDPLTRDSLRARLLARGPIIPDEVPEPGCVPAPVEIRPSPREKPRAPDARQSVGWF